MVRSDMDAQTLDDAVYQARYELDRDEADLSRMEMDLELLGVDPGGVAKDPAAQAEMDDALKRLRSNLAERPE